MKNTEIPLSDRDQLAESTNGLIIHDLRLPVGTDEERIVLDSKRLLKAAHYAGSEALELTFDFSTRQKPDFIDAQHLGGGMLAARGLKKTPEHFGNFQYKELEDTDPHDAIGQSFARARSLKIELDKTAMMNRVTDSPHNRRGPLDEELWSKELDTAIKRTIIDAARFRFFKNESRSFSNSRVYAATMIEGLVLYGVWPATALSVAKLEETVDFNSSAAVHATTAGLSLAVINSLGAWLCQKDNARYICSAFPFSKIDRYPLAAARMRAMGRAVRYLC